MPDFVINLLPKEGKLVQINPSCVSNRFIKYLKRLDMRRFRFHDLRHPYVKSTTKIKYSAFGWDWQMQSVFYLAFYVLLYETLDKLV